MNIRVYNELVTEPLSASGMSELDAVILAGMIGLDAARRYVADTQEEL